MHLMFIAALFTIAKTGKQPKCPSADEQILKNVIHIYNGTLHSKKKKNEIMAFAATWMDLEIIIQVKSDRKWQVSYDIIYMWNLKHDTNEPLKKKKQTHKHRKNRLVVAKGDGVGEGCTVSLG